MPYYGQKLAIKVKFYGKVVRMAKKCYLFLNVLFNPQILSHQKVKLVGESLRKYLIAALGGDPKVHSGEGGRQFPSFLKLIFFWSFLTIFGHFWHFFLLFQACYRKNTVVKIHWQPISRTMVPFTLLQQMTKVRAFFSVFRRIQLEKHC